MRSIESEIKTERLGNALVVIVLVPFGFAIWHLLKIGLVEDAVAIMIGCVGVIARQAVQWFTIPDRDLGRPGRQFIPPRH